jgi:glucose/arabinose dehydrogenase
MFGLNFRAELLRARRGKRSGSSPSSPIESLERRTLFAALPSGFSDSVIASGLTSPTAMEFAPDGRAFITIQSGQVLLYKNGHILPTPFVTLHDVDGIVERGLLSVTVDPNFDQNHYVYFFYTANDPVSHNRVVRFTANGDVADPNSEVDLIDLPNIGSAIWHMGGAMHFGPDGKLYVALGDYQQSTTAQNLNVLTGKILRFNADGSIPADNPFYSTATGMNRAIWAYGLRNPFSSAFDPGSGKFFINNVGEDEYETIFLGRAGANYGWPTAEGPRNNPAFDQPIYVYAHGSPGNAVIGGAFYDGVTPQFPQQYANQYFFADYVQGWIKTMNPTTHVVSSFATGFSFPDAVRVSPDGSLFILTRGTQREKVALDSGLGGLEQVRYTPATSPKITLQPTNQLANVGGSVTFTASASGAQPLTYQWQRNGQNLANTNSPSYTLSSVSAADNGAKFDVVVTNSFGSATSTSATLTVSAAKPPTGTITLSPNATLYTAGDTFTATATGKSSTGAALPAGAFVWQVDFQHETHAHPFVPPTPGVNKITFTIPRTGETSPVVWYRIYLTVTDPLTQLSTTIIREIHPREATITVNSNIPGLGINVDGQPAPLPDQVLGVAGITRSLSAPLSEVVNGTTYVFESWSDGGAATHNINFPLTNTTYTATYHQEDVTYLSSLTPVGTVVNGMGPVHLDKNDAGQTITLNGVTYPKGLGVHASYSAVYALSGLYDRFVSDIGVDDEAAAAGSVDFQLWLDGVKIFDSGKLGGDSPTQTVNVNVAGGQQLKLVVTDTGNGNTSDDADWANAQLLSKPQPTTKIIGGIIGHAVNDVNGNGIWDNGDKRLAGWAVYLDANNNGKLDPGERQTTTGSMGDFWFGNLAPGTYTVRLAPPAGWTATGPKSGAITLTVVSGKKNYITFCQKKV